MRVFLYEFTCGGGLVEQPGMASLRSEGRAMLAALLEDFHRLPNVQVFTILEAEQRAGDLFPVSISPYAFRRVRNGEEERLFREAVRQADYTLVIAPESNGILATRCRWVAEEGGRSLGSSLETINLCTDKLELSRHLSERNVATPTSQVDESGGLPSNFPPPWVWKPRDGAGAQAMFFIQRVEELPACRKQAKIEGWTGEAIIQPLVPGTPVSVMFLVGPHGHVPLLPAFQDLSDDGRFRYRGGRVPLPMHLRERAVRAAEAAITSVPGLNGYVGVDLVLGESADGRDDCVIEINPRLTTSYLGLRALAQTNLARAMLDIAERKPTPEIRWRDGTIRFSAGGTCF